MKVTLPADSASAISEVGGIAALLDKNGWKAAAFIAVSVKPGEGTGRKPATSGRLSTVAFAKALNAKGWSKTIIQRHYEAWEAAAADGIVTPAADLVYGEKIDLPIDGWSTYYPPPTEADSRYANVDDKDAIVEEAKADGLSGSKAVDIAKNPKSMAAAIKASPKVAKAAAKALVDAGALDTLSSATAAASKNKLVERNRKRASEGESKVNNIEKGKPPVYSAEATALMTMKSQGIALRAIVTDFPNEWANLPDEAKTEELVEWINEGWDKLIVAIDNARILMQGQVTDKDLEDLLSGGGES